MQGSTNAWIAGYRRADHTRSCPNQTIRNVRPNRGRPSAYGLFFVSIGAFVIASVFVAWSYGPLCNLETEVPDAVGLGSMETVADSV